ncbi:MAG: YjzD family protein [Enterococcus lacertideformus]|uniref:YjzD family protein n=1 Tax=Enterococcus lacertideformus TaxID=2771493 RepID=A0A931AVC4_9ENTE|nr:YjzD family protein [Enterococcus lacertideformus]
MRYIVTLFWSFVLGQVVGYIGGALTIGAYDFTLKTIISLIAGFIVILLGALASPKKEASSHS